MKLKSYKKVTAHFIPKVNQILKRKRLRINMRKGILYVLMNGKKLPARDTSGKFPYILARPMFPFGNTADVRSAYIQSFVQHISKIR